MQSFPQIHVHLLYMGFNRFIFSGFRILLFTMPLVFSCSKNGMTQEQQEVSVPTNTGVEDVLFIGNSHTYYNSGIAFHVGRFRANDGLTYEPYIQELAFGGFSLAVHLENEATLDKLNERTWEVIVLQENTSVATNDGMATIEAVKSFQQLVGQKGTKIFLYMTWPYKDEPSMFTNIRTTYDEAAKATGATIIPVGEVWLSILAEERNDIDLYDIDGVHPTLQGTYLAAAMCYDRIFRKNPSDNLYNAGLDPTTAQYLKQKAE